MNDFCSISCDMIKYYYRIDSIMEIDCISEDHANWKWKKCIMKIILCSLMICICLTQIITSASAADYRLEIYGNANLDNAINEEDIEYVEYIIEGKNKQTYLADANQDGSINEKDLAAIEQLIDGTYSELTIIDSANRTVKVKVPVQRIVVFHYGAAEAIQTLSGTDKIVAVDRYTANKTSIYSGLKDATNIGYVDNPDFEKIISLKPDVVFVFANIHDYDVQIDRIHETLKDADPNITIIASDFVGVENYPAELAKLGYILNKRHEAEEFIQFYNNWMDNIKGRLIQIPENDRAKVYFEMWWPDAYSTCSVGSFGLDDSLRVAGGINIFGDHNASFFNVDPEEVMVQNPDVILKYEASGYAKAGSGFGGDSARMKEIVGEIRDRKELQEVNAVKDERIYIITWDVLCGGAKHMVGISYMAKWFYPELFNDISEEDIEAVHREYLTKYMGLDYDPEKLGAFVYPSPRVQ